MADARRATLERQLARYVARRLPPATSPAQVRRRQTLRRHVIRECIQRLRALAVRGHERGWRETPLTAEDRARVETLVEGMLRDDN